MRLLVLDDEIGIATLVAGIAKKLSWTAETATEPLAFRRRFSAAPPDLVLLDMQLGAADGIEQLRFLGEQKFRGQIVLMSGFDWRVLEAAQQVGTSLGLAVVALLQKPMRVTQLRAVLTRVARDIQAKPAAGNVAASRAQAPDGDERSTRLRLTSVDVDRALSDNELSLFLQPVVEAGSGRTMRFEGLCRWSHPTIGMIPPDRFIPLAESDGDVIDRLTMWVVREAAAHFRQLTAADVAAPISVNVSARNIQRLDFPDRVAALAAEEGARPDALILEITESVAMANTAFTIDVLARLRLKGFRLAMDDFGTGFSSLKALRQMPFSELKIDKSFVIDMLSSRDSAIIVKSVVDLARNMGLESVAEGVETAAIADALAGLQVTGLQGYHFARPMPVDQSLTWARGRLSPAAAS